MSTNDSVQELAQRLSDLPGVRATLVARGSLAVEGAGSTGFSPEVARDIAKTIARVFSASVAQGTQPDKVVISFGATELLVVPWSDEFTVILLMTSNTGQPQVLELLGSRTRSPSTQLAPEVGDPWGS